MEFAEFAALHGAVVEHLEVGDLKIPDRCSIEYEGLPAIVASAEYNSGTFCRVVFTAHVDRLVHVPDIELAPETDAERSAKRIGVNREVQIGDEAFDDAVYIATEAGDRTVRRLFEPPRVREIVRRFIEEGRELWITGGVRWSITADCLSAATPERLRALAELAAALPDVRDVIDDHEGPRQPKISYVAYGVVVALMYAAAIVARPILPLFSWHAFLCFVYSLPLWFVVAVIVFLDRRGRSRSSTEIGVMWFVSLGVLVVPGTSLMAWLNQHWDPSKPHVEEVQARYLGFDDEDDEHAIEVHGLLGAAKTRLEYDEDELKVDPKTLRALRLTIGDGYFGWPYVLETATVP